MPYCKHVFTYGSLMFDEVWTQVVQGRYRCAPATIYGFARKCVKGEHYPALVRASKEDRVSGRVYFSVSPADIRRLDQFEGSQYCRVSCAASVDVQNLPRPEAKSLAGSIDVNCYLWRDGFRQLLQTKDWDEAAFRRQGLLQFVRKYRGFDR